MQVELLHTPKPNQLVAALVLFAYELVNAPINALAEYFPQINWQKRRGDSAFIGGVIALFVAVIVAVALFPAITSGINSLTSGASPALTGTAATLVGQVPLFLALALMLVAVAFALLYVKKARTGGGRAYDTEMQYNSESKTWFPLKPLALRYIPQPTI